MKKIIVSIIVLILVASNTIAATKPTIITQPLGQTNLAGSTFSLLVAASGTTPLKYQWFSFPDRIKLPNGVYITNTNGFKPITGATNKTCYVTGKVATVGGYRVIVTNTVGRVTSSVARIVITNIPSAASSVMKLMWHPVTNIVFYEVWRASDLSSPFSFLKNTGTTTNLLITNSFSSSPKLGFFTTKAVVSWRALLTWDPPNCTNVVGYYKVYYGIASKMYTNTVNSVGSNCTAMVVGLLPGTKYYFAVTTLDDAGLASDYSEEVSGEPPDTITNRIPIAISLAR